MIDSLTLQQHESVSSDVDLPRIALEIITDAMICTNACGDVTHINKAAEDIIGMVRSQVVGRPVAQIFTTIEDRSMRYLTGMNERRPEGQRELSIKLNDRRVLLRHDGSEVAIEVSTVNVQNHDGMKTGSAIVFRDARYSHETTTRMTHLAQHDSLTGLCNRLALSEKLSHALGLARRHGRQVALLFIDLDNFKTINDSLGHESGDRMLVKLSRHLEECVRITDTVCRYGGDEFVVLLSEIELPDDAEGVARKIISELPKSANNSEISLSLSIGISVYPGDGIDAETLLNKADAAMYQVKSSGKCTHQFFQNRTDVPERQRARSAVSNGS